ncbi:MAG: agmatine deiminase family protein [Paludibacteraceae bacterium]|nr:agmatine deiminase family protein [Paludibacteraceae bacterium]
MNYEFIIGTIIGVAGLILTWICSKEQIKSYFKPSMKDLLNQLTSTSLSPRGQKAILRKINRKLKIYGKSLSSDYIDTFSPKSNTKTAILLDMCLANMIEPTPDICKAFLDYNSPALRNDYLQAIKTTEDKTEIEATQKQESSENKQANAMKPNTVYVSGILKEKFPHAAEELFSVLRKHKVTVKELTNTKDIWCRDYMPVQNSQGELIQFNYDPSYLKGEKVWEDSRSDVHEVCEANGIKPIYTDIKIDGGNVVMFGDKAILTNRIFSENPEYDKDALVSEIERLLKTKVLIIPAYSISEDVTGHADGMVRFVDEYTILGNDLTEDYDYIKKGINKMCQAAGLKYIDVPYFIPEKDKNHEMNAIGIYVNYLEVNNLIVLPRFGVKGNRDEETIEIFRKIFPDRIIETVDYNEVAIEGGLLNCTTWTIKE